MSSFGPRHDMIGIAPDPLGRGGSAFDQAAALAQDRAARVRETARDRREGRSPLFDLRPSITTRRAYFRSIEIPASLTFSSSAWYVFGQWRIGEDIQSEVALTGHRIVLGPTDPDASAGQAWGDTSGNLAAIVIAKNLAFPRSEWIDRRAYIPGVESAEDLETPDTAPEFIEVIPFPPGKANDTSPAKLYLAERYGADQVPLTLGDTLSVAIVVRGAQIQAASGAGSILGIADVRLSLAELDAAYEWRS